MEQHESAPVRKLGYLIPLLGLLAVSCLQILSRAPWAYTGDGVDAWFYHGYFLNLRHHIAAYAGTYYGTRLAWILVGALAHSILSPDAANLALRFFLYWSSIVSVFFSVARFYGTRCAVICGLLLTCNPYFLSAIGWDYVDGAGIAYALIGLEELGAAIVSTSNRSRILRGFFSGLALTAAIHSNVFLLILGAPLLLLLVGRAWRSAFSIAASILAGGVVLTIGLGLISQRLGGPFLFFMPSLRASVGFMSVNPFYVPPSVWITGAYWLAIPVGFSVACLVVAIGWMLRRSSSDPAPWTRIIDLSCLPFLFCIFFALNARGSGVLQISYYSSYLTIFVPLACAALIGRGLDSWTFREFFGLIAGLFVLAVFVGTFPEGWLPHRLAVVFETVKTTPKIPVIEMCVIFFAGVVISVWVRPRWMKLTVLTLALVSVDFRSTHQAMVGNGRYNDRQVYLDVDRTLHELIRQTGDQQLWFWFNYKRRTFAHYTSIASTYLFELGALGEKLPDTRDFRFGSLKPGNYLAFLETDPLVLAKAKEALAENGVEWTDVARITAHAHSEEYPIWLVKVSSLRVPARAYFPPPTVPLSESSVILDLSSHDAVSQCGRVNYGQIGPVAEGTPEGSFAMTDKRDHCATPFQQFAKFGEVDAVEVELEYPPESERFGRAHISLQDQGYTDLYFGGFPRAASSKTIVGLTPGASAVRIVCLPNAQGYVRVPQHIRLTALRKAR